MWNDPLRAFSLFCPYFELMVSFIYLILSYSSIFLRDLAAYLEAILFREVDWDIYGCEEG